jgi:Raf kinase inhibitor-like YbhB/YbcL family protein
MQLTSQEFKDGETLKAVFTVEGEDISPPLAWKSPPVGTKSFALICDDPDAPSARNPGPEPWVHWVIYNLPAEARELPAAVSDELEVTMFPGVRQGRNSWLEHNVGYRGPAPPRGSGPHRYIFHLYALDSVLSLAAGATKLDLLTAMKTHLLAEAKLTGIYER